MFKAFCLTPTTLVNIFKFSDSLKTFSAALASTKLDLAASIAESRLTKSVLGKALAFLKSFCADLIALFTVSASPGISLGTLEAISFLTTSRNFVSSLTNAGTLVLANSAAATALLAALSCSLSLATLFVCALVNGRVVFKPLALCASLALATTSRKSSISLETAACLDLASTTARSALSIASTFDLTASSCFIIGSGTIPRLKSSRTLAA